MASKISLKTKISYLKEEGNRFFSTNGAISLPFSHSRQMEPDLPNLLLSCSYSDFCFDNKVTKVAERETFESINEVSSGNNDLGYFSFVHQEANKILHRTNYHLSNYSGGRGDYFTLQQLAQIETAICELEPSAGCGYGVENLCITNSGQGGYSAIASYFNLPKFRQKKVAFFDSTYAPNYRPFVSQNVPVDFISTPEDSYLPLAEDLFEYLRSEDVSALFLSSFHNPSGECYSEREITQLLKILNEREIYLIHAEAFASMNYGRLNGEVDRGSRLISLASEIGFENLIRVRTLSKDRGLAGLRAAYLIAQEEVTRYVSDRNDEYSYNPPMVNGPVIVLSRYLEYRCGGGEILTGVETWLDLPNLRELEKRFMEADKSQLCEIFQNVQLIASELFGVSISRDEDLDRLKNENFEMVIPKGGMNICLRVKFLDSACELDVFRKVFLNTGVILHSAKFISNKNSGYWIRITIGHKASRIQTVLSVLKSLMQSVADYRFLPKGSLHVSADFTPQPLNQTCSHEKELKELMLLGEAENLNLKSKRSATYLHAN